MSKGSESIFPVTGEIVPHPDRDCNAWTGSFGLTKRELFAAMAMQSLAVPDSGPADQWAPEAARRAVMYADALLAELAKGEGGE